MALKINSSLRVLDFGRPALSAGRDFASDVQAGLSKEPKSIPSVYFYDKTGSELFCRITHLSEYYLTRCEAEILRRYAWALSGMFRRSQPFNLIELGAGDGMKTSILIERFLKDGLCFNYIPVDICAQSVRKSVRKFMEPCGGHFCVTGLVSDYFGAMRWMSKETGGRNIVLFLGSTVGNFRRDEAREFLSELSASLKSGDLLFIGFDLKKDAALLNRAYNDKAGITREFNLNLLDRMNRELGANFNRAKFEHSGRYNEEISAMESWLISLEDQSVEFKEMRACFSFKKGEEIHTEYSHKYSVDDIQGLAREAGFRVVKNLFDSRKFFADSLWRVR